MLLVPLVPPVPRALQHLPTSLCLQINMNQVIRGVDFELGASNPGAIGLFFHGAQGATVQDVAISCKDCFACFGGAGGAGGSHIHIEGRGGQYGMYISESEPAPVVAAATFSGQTTSAIYFSQNAQPPLILVGVKIEQSAAVAVGEAVILLPPSFHPH